MRKTYKALFEFLDAGNAYAETHDDRLAYAIKKVIRKNLGAGIESWNESLADLRLDYASVDANQNLLRDERGELLFTAPRQRELDQAARALRLREFDFDPYYVAAPELDEFTAEALLDFVLQREDSFVLDKEV